MSYYFSQNHAYAVALLTLAVLQEHVYALPAPWPLLLDAVIMIEQHQAQTKARRWMPKVKDIPVVGDELKDTPLGDQEISTPQGMVANAAADEAEKHINGSGKKSAETTSEPTPTQKSESPAPEKTHNQDSGNKGHDQAKQAGTIAGSTIGAVVIVVLLIGLLVWWLIRRGNRKTEEQTAEKQDDDVPP